METLIALLFLIIPFGAIVVVVLVIVFEVQSRLGNRRREHENRDARIQAISNQYR